MGQKIAYDEVENPEGRFDISTIRTFAGGADDYQLSGCPFSDADYADRTPWPFETVVFRRQSSKGLYHQAYATKEEARAGHGWIVATVRAGLELPGVTVEGPFGNPTLTVAEWNARHAQESTP